jgi:hypothetical protein
VIRNVAKAKPRKREQVFLVTVAVDEERYSPDCSRVLTVLKQAGYTARPMNHRTLELVYADPESIPQFREIGESHDPPPTAA